MSFTVNIVELRERAAKRVATVATGSVTGGDRSSFANALQNVLQPLRPLRPLLPCYPDGVSRVAALAGVAANVGVPEAVHDGARTCSGCSNRLRHGTCSEPVAAGLAPKFEIRWPPAGHAQTCPAYSAKTPTPAQDRPFRLSRAAADRCHLGGWKDAEIELFTARTLHFIRRGVTAGDADDLSERLTLRDRDADDRRLCLECRHFRPGRCGNYQAAGLGGPGLPRDLTTQLQRCPGFKALEVVR